MNLIQNLIQSVYFRGFSVASQAIRQNKMLVLGIILLQTMMIAAVVGIFFNYQVKIIGNAQQIIQPIQTANYNIKELQGGQPFIQDIFAVHQSYLALKKNVLQLAAILLGLYFTIQGALWVVTQHLLHHGTWKQAGQRWLKHSIASAVLFGPYFLASFFIIKNLVLRGTDLASFSTITKNLAIALGVWYYFSLVAFALTNTTSWKRFVQHWFNLAISRIYQTIFVVVTIAAVIGATLYLSYLTIMQTDSLLLMIGALLLFMAALVCSRIFWVAALHALLAQGESAPGEFGGHHQRSHYGNNHS